MKNQPNHQFGFLTFCPNCSVSLKTEDFRLVKQQVDKKIFYLYCPNCHGSMLLCWHQLPESASCTIISSDCNFSDAQRFLAASPVNADDVIGVHQALALDNFLQIM